MRLLKLFFSLVLMVTFSFTNNNPTVKTTERRGSMNYFPYKNPNFSYLGRWKDDGGKYSGWGGSTIAFKFTGTSLKIEVDANNTPGQSIGGNVVIDGFPRNWTQQFYASTNGVQQITVATGLTDTTHTVFLRFWTTNYTAKRDGTDYIKFKGVILDDLALLLKWRFGPVKVGYFGDSWASAGQDTTKWIDWTKFEVNSISDPGFTSNDAVARYPYSVGTVPITDPAFDAVVLAYGVNDAYNYSVGAGITPTVFKNNAKFLIDKVKLANPNVKIFLVQQPDNSAGPVDTSIFGTVLQELANENTNCVFVSMKPIESQLTWGDLDHLNANGAQIYAEYLTQQMSPYFTFDEALIPNEKLEIELATNQFETIALYESQQPVEVVLNNEIRLIKLVDIDDPNASNIEINLDGVLGRFRKYS